MRKSTEGMRVKRHHKSGKQSAWRGPRSRKFVQAILAECQDSGQLCELYYFSREPGVLEILRAVVALPEEARAALEAFFAMSHEPAAITADWDARGRLTLTSPQVGQTMAVMEFCAQNEDADATPTLN